MNGRGLYARLPLFYLYRRFGRPKQMPLSIVISVSYRCNSRCATCDVWRKPNDDLTIDEWRRSSAASATRRTT